MCCEHMPQIVNSLHKQTIQPYQKTSFSHCMTVIMFYYSINAIVKESKWAHHIPDTHSTPTTPCLSRSLTVTDSSVALPIFLNNSKYSQSRNVQVVATAPSLPCATLKRDKALPSTMDSFHIDWRSKMFLPSHSIFMNFVTQIWNFCFQKKVFEKSCWIGSLVK